jgi:rhomboid family GlyGly-CTERM serine protease
MPLKALPTDKSKLGHLPWFTLVAGALAVGAWFWPGAFDALAYNRAQILHGEWWRLITGHWVHFSASHLFWDLAILIPAGALLERRNPTALRGTILLSPLAISLTLLAFDPAMAIYAGISGVAAGVLVALAAHGLRTEPATRWVWLAVLALFALKVVIETSRGGQPLNPELTAQGVRSVPLAHIVGAAVGASAALLSRRRNKQNFTANKR